MKERIPRDAALAIIVALAIIGRAAFGAPDETTKQRKPCRDYYPERIAHFGDLHVHTALSLDAIKQGTLTRPKDAYAYATGRAIAIPPYDHEGQAIFTAAIGQPIDFASVTDHAELLGETHICHTPGVEGYWSLTCIGMRLLPDLAAQWVLYKAASGERTGLCGAGGKRCLKAAVTPWQEIIDAAEKAYDRSEECSFTSFIGYEWTAATFVDGGVNIASLHRNVIFRNADVPRLPGSFIEYSDTTSLWQYLSSECSDAEGTCDAVVIPHNSNISLGLMFPGDSTGIAALDIDDIEGRARYERLAEIIQQKGVSECYSGPGATDELCDFEQLPWNNFTGNRYESRAQPIAPDAGYLRDVLKYGLVMENSLDLNPYKFGFIGSTDTHRSLAGGVAERDFPGHGGAGNPAVEVGYRGLPDEWEFNPGGLAVLYAEENTRDSLFTAMQRREAYATSGTRIGVRFFGGWEFPRDICGRSDQVAQGYLHGVPMGGELRPAAGETPHFLVSAAKSPGSQDSSGVDLQRLQIIKGWVDSSGDLREVVYDVAGSPGNDVSVDPATCKTSGPGHGQLCTVWQDPEFDASQPAFYYARVLENPSCRWSTYYCYEQRVDCGNAEDLSEESLQCCNPGMVEAIQERAWTSPIWYRSP